MRKGRMGGERGCEKRERGRGCEKGKGGRRGRDVRKEEWEGGEGCKKGKESYIIFIYNVLLIILLLEGMWEVMDGGEVMVHLQLTRV